MKKEDLVIGKEYIFEGDGIVTLIKVNKNGFYLKGVKNTYAEELDGSVGFMFDGLKYLTEIKQ